MPKIPGQHFASYEVDHAGKLYTFTKSFLSIGNGYTPINVTANNTSIIMNGTIEARNGATALAVQGVNVDVVVGQAGEILGQGVGIYSYDDKTTVTNRGYISTSPGNADVWLNGVKSEVVNYGTMKQGVDIRGGDSLVLNKAGGELASTNNTTVSILLNAGETAKLINQGLITGNTAFAGYEGDEVVINRGNIVGTMRFGGGDDLIDTRGGIINGQILGGTGHDTLITHKASYVLTEYSGEGFDTIRSTVTYTLSENVEQLVLLGAKHINASGNDGANDLIGNAGNNVLRGRGSFDDIDGGKGNDRLFGGTGSDGFAFRTGYGRDIIEDFNQAENDLISLSDWKAIKNFEDLINNHAKNRGDDVVIRAGDDELVIRGIHKDELQSGDFLIL